VFRKFKLGTKIFGSFALILILIISLACFNFYELRSIISRVSLADDINKLVGNIFSARQQEKNFIIRGDSVYIDKVINETQKC
jgi:methyl-accepting chemotaxis protein